ncbi:MAG: molybdate ABC transporter substrate-binding protein [Dehalococcoidia bacterium]
MAKGRSRWRWLPWLLSMAVLVALVGVACSGDDDDTKPDAATPTTGAGSSTAAPTAGDITVFAASSLTDAFKEAGTAFEAKYPDAKVTFSFAASSALAVQINEGAPADVFASADTNQMKNVADKGNVEESSVFVKNTPVIVVPKGDTTVSKFDDLANPGVRLVLAAAEVPVGKYAREILQKASATGGISIDFGDKVLANLKSNEANVRAVLTKVQLGEADAGIVYKTDVGAAANDVAIVEIPEKYNAVATYPIAVVKATKNHDAAAAFVAFIQSDAGQAILEKYGFVKP